MSIESCDIITIIEEICSLMAPLAENKGLLLVHGIKGQVPPQIQADVGRLRQVINKLVSNAIKFTHDGQVSIVVEPEGDVVAVRIQDTGIGIPDHKIDTIFHAFEQIDGSDQRQYGGTGLGLSISRRLCGINVGVFNGGK